MQKKRLILSSLLLISSAVCVAGSQDSNNNSLIDHEAEIVTTNDAYRKLVNKVSSAKQSIVSLWRNKPTLSGLKKRVPRWQDVKEQLSYANVKTKLCNMSTTIKNNKLITGLIIGLPLAAYVGYRYYKGRKRK